MRRKPALVAIGGLAVATLLGATTLNAFAGDLTPAIAGGHEVAAAPWSAQLDIGGGACSGTIVAAHWALSAAHCVEDDPNPAKYTVRVGDVRLGQGTVAKVKSMQTRFDLVLLELDRDIVTTYATLAATDPPTGAAVDIYGWGVTCEDGCGQSPVLKTARMRVSAINGNTDGSRMVDLAQSGDGYALGGDSGGPAMYNGVQFGVLCCGNTAPDGSGIESYSSVANSLAWITSTTGAGGGTATNLALNHPTKTSAACNANETGAKAVNGSVSGGSTDKWCSGAAGTKRLEVDLGANHAIKRLVVKHAGAGGESSSLNTKNFALETSTGGGIWMTAATVTNNTASTTTSPVAVTARWIRISTTDAVARIYEFEAYS
jgi:hypothetical protein